MLDIFRSDAFSLTSLTDAFIKTPYKPGRIGALGLFRSRGVATTSVIIEEKDGRLSLIQTSPRGAADPSTIGNQKRTARSFAVPHLERNSTVLADSVQNVRAFGSENATDAVQAVVNERLADLRAMHEVTLEHMRAGAIQGLVKDADGSTLVDLFTAFNVSQQTAQIAPDSSTDNGDTLRGQIVAIQRLIEAELGAEPISSYRAFCGPDFFDAIRSDLSVTKTLRFADPMSLLQQQANARVFSFGGVTFEEYRKSSITGTFFADDECFVFPEGTNIFAIYYAPADFAETVNTLGLPGYAKIAPDPEFNRYVKVHTQSNPLTICLRPRAVVKVTLAT
jgi:hypothetical protein